MTTEPALQLDFLGRIQAEFPEYWAWLQSKPSSMQKINEMAASYEKLATSVRGNKQYASFSQAVQGLKSFATFGTAPIPDPEVDPPPLEDPLLDEPLSDWVDPMAEQNLIQQRADLRSTLQQFLTDNELSLTLMGFIENAIAQSMPFSEIILRLRETPEYKAAYPENDIRRGAGFSWQPESWIRAYRDEAKRIASEYLGINLSNTEIAEGLIGMDKSLSEWERIIIDWRNFERWGPIVKNVLWSELGYEPADDRVFAAISMNINTPEFDMAMESAKRRGQPAALGLGIRPEEEDDILRQYGISPEQAFAGYQGIVKELPRANRLAMIEAEINRTGTGFPTGGDIFGDTPFSTLFRGIQLQDPESLQKLSVILSRENARWQSQGGVATAGGVAAGLLTEEERRQLK